MTLELARMRAIHANLDVEHAIKKRDQREAEYQTMLQGRATTTSANSAHAR